MTLRSAQCLIAAGLLGVGVLGCLRAFGPDLRGRGVHSGAAAGDGADDCMNCHQSEADALARMHRSGHAANPAVEPSEDGPPLVADWMVADPRPCTDCHRIRE